MELKLLRSFIELADAGHYGKTAAKLFITQSTLSKQIQALEESVGGALFERGRHGAILTPLGMLLKREARALLRLSEDIDVKMRRANAGLTGQLDIGFGISTLVIAPKLIAGFRAVTPDSQITLNDLPSRTQHERLLSGRLDIGICRAPEEGDELSFMPLIEEQLALVLPQEVEFPAPDQMSTLNQLGFVALSPSSGPGLDKQLSRWCAANGFKPRIVQHAEDILTVHAVVAAGLGAALLPWHGVNALAGRTHQQPLSGIESTWPVGLCWHRKQATPLLSRFVDYVSKHR
ncbi:MULTISPECIES: LysR substrate-binding domain-containing protein [unclassified Rhizobium]|uniref:LysR family transcriptional regulator n=1 Tax=unclassified Rhizobium TaxID=2613769 RepID=UPI000EA89043|nr:MULTISPECIES: LysR substrate-binding domain-containing protein [unclassified Rhizobium]AYG66404.1 LysR family transcriptional regulator [Rhizobium sp. CCGE531]AYG72785.1 LysR family transcriptional regulator [Rhizobium sp. CCGE532]